MNFRRLLRTSLLAWTALTASWNTANGEAVGGPRSLDRLIAHDASDTITPILFAGGRQAIIRVEEKTAATLLVSVYNPDGTLLRSFAVNGYTWRKFWFDPPAEGRYKVVITNLSDSLYGEYSLQAN
jgi:hypothetical protein